MTHATPGAAAPPRSILLADCDVYYVQVARMADPDGAGRAPLLIVGGSAESRGVVCSASYEVRRFGVRSGMPIARAVRLCPQAMCVPVPRALCATKSAEIVRVLERFAPEVESASPDEAYLDLTTTMRSVYRGRTLEDLGATIRAAVERETGIRISIGGGTSKLVAKLAVERAKPRDGSGGSGVHIVAPGDEAAFVAGLRLADIPGIGPKFQEQLDKLGWREVRQLLGVTRADLQRILGERAGAWLHDVVRGVDTTPVARRVEPKSMGREETFPRDVADDAALERELLRLVDRVTSDLRESGYATRTVTVKLKDADFTLRSAARTLDEGITTWHAMAPVARELLHELRQRRRVPARLIGVSASQLAPIGSEEQLALFGGERDGGAGAGVETERQRQLAAALDAVRSRHGRSAIRLGEAPEE